RKAEQASTVGGAGLGPAQPRRGKRVCPGKKGARGGNMVSPTLKLGEDSFVRRAHPDDLTALQLELVEPFARQLYGQVVPRGGYELAAGLEAEVHDPADHRLEAVCDRLVADVEVVRSHPALPELVRLADEAHHELGRRMVVEICR